MTTLIPQLERELAGASRRRRRRQAVRIGAGGAAIALAGAALVFVPGLGDAGDERDARPAAPADTVPEPPGGAHPQLEDLLGVFRRAPTPRDQTGDTVADLEATGDRQPGEDPTRSRRIDLPDGPVYLWRMKDGVCASWGNCLQTASLRELGVAISMMGHSGRPTGSPGTFVISGIAVDGIDQVQIGAEQGDQLVVPVQDNVFQADVSHFASRPTRVLWRDWRGPRREVLPNP